MVRLARPDPAESSGPLRLDENQVRQGPAEVLQQLREAHVPFVLITRTTRDRTTHDVIRPTTRLVQALELGIDLDPVLDSPASPRKQQLGHARRNSALRSRPGLGSLGAAGASHVAVTIQLPGRPTEPTTTPKIRFKCTHSDGHVVKLPSTTSDNTRCPEKLAHGIACPGRLFRF